MGNSYGVGLSCSLQQHTGSHILEPQKLRAYLRVHVSACYILVLHVLLNVNKPKPLVCGVWNFAFVTSWYVMCYGSS